MIRAGCEGDEGTMQAFPHTQSAVNNFLGMHRFDGVGFDAITRRSI